MLEEVPSNLRSPEGRISNMAVSKAQQAATNKWIAKSYDRVNLTMQKGKKAAVKAHAESRGESVNSFINRAIDEAMERDNEYQK